MSRTGSSPGRPSRPTTRPPARTCRSTSRGAARAVRRSPGTPTPRRGSATRTCAASCWRCGGRRTGPARRPGRGVGGDYRGPGAHRAVQGRPRQGRLRPVVLARGQRADRGGARAHGAGIRAGPGGRVFPDPGDVAGLLRGGDPVPVDDRRHDPVLLRLVCRHAGRLAAGVRRPDRRAGVRGLVERRLPGHLGHEPADHPHARRALHDRGPLPRAEGGGGLPGLLRPHQVRRRLAGRRARAPTARWRWRWGT